MRLSKRVGLAALCAAGTLLLAGQANAATVTVNFSTSDQTWISSGAGGAAFGIASTAPHLSGSFSFDDTGIIPSTFLKDQDVLDRIISLSFTAGNQVYSQADISLTAGSFGGFSAELEFRPDGFLQNYALFLNIAGNPQIADIYTNFLGLRAAPGSNYVLFCINCSTFTTDPSSPVIPPIPSSHTPEPATWVMMLVGFLAVGSVLRRRRYVGVIA